MGIQARELWSTSEEVHYRPGHFWLAQAPVVLEVRKINTRCTIEGVMFSAGDYLVRICRYFLTVWRVTRVASRLRSGRRLMAAALSSTRQSCVPSTSP